MLDTLFQYIQLHENLVFWSLVISGVTFVSTLAIVPVLAIQIPDNYFSHNRHKHAAWSDHHPVIRIILLIGKNLLGYVIILMGLAMLVIPGQGMLTIVIGLVLINFPGKYRLERWLITRKPVLTSINWFRVKGGRAPLLINKLK